MMKKIDWRKKDRSRYRAGERGKLSGYDLKDLYFGKHGSVYDSAMYHSDECSTVALLTTHYTQTGPITVSFLLW